MISSFELQSRILSLPVHLTVLLPDLPAGRSGAEFYRSGTRYKVLFLLHGATGNDHQWLYQTNLARHVERRPLAVVCPDGLNSDYANHPEMFGGYDYTDFFFQELLPFIQGWLPVSDRPEDTYVAGLSMGGSGAMLLGLTHPELFGGIGMLSATLRKNEFLRPYAALSSAEFRQLALADPTQFPTEFGDPAAGITRKEINMICKYASVGEYLASYEYMWSIYPQKAAQLPPVYAAMGTEDSSYANFLKFQQAARDCAAPHTTFVAAPGYGHTADFWDDILPEMLDHFGL